MGHRDGIATACPGDVIYAWICAGAVPPVLDDGNASSIPPALTKPKPKPKPKGLEVDGKLGPATIRRWQQFMGTTVDGVISQPSELVRAVQRRLNKEHGLKLKVDGLGIRSNNDGDVGPTYTIRALQRHLGQKADGVLSHPTSRAVAELQRRLNAGKL
jgi:peptidoglycan hydrolase-like protein with peptidoglycan-binding domain